MQHPALPTAPALVRSRVWSAGLLAGMALALSACAQERERTPHSSSAEPSPSSAESAASARLEALRAVGYVDFSPEPADASEGSGVTLWDRERTQPGFNLYCSRSRPEAYLMSLDGEVRHLWTYPDPQKVTWTHVLLQPDGSLLVLVKFRYLMLLDRNSKRLWKRAAPVHHDVWRDPDGALLVLLREIREHRGLDVAFPAVGWLNPRGKELARWSAAEHLPELRAAMDDSSFLDRVLDDLTESGGAELDIDESKPFDYFHANTVSRLPATELGSRDPRFRAGNLLLCFRNVDQLLILDGESHEPLWSYGSGELQWPHHPTMLPDGNILVFDNGDRRESTRVLEIEPLSGEIQWSYAGSPPESFYSHTKGSAQRLAGGNTLICEGDAGRVFEVTPAGEIVWEWRNPWMSEGRRGAIYRMTRVTAQQAAGALGAAAADPSSTPDR